MREKDATWLRPYPYFEIVSSMCHRGKSMIARSAGYQLLSRWPRLRHPNMAHAMAHLLIRKWGRGDLAARD